MLQIAGICCINVEVSQTGTVEPELEITKFCMMIDGDIMNIEYDPFDVARFRLSEDDITRLKQILKSPPELSKDVIELAQQFQKDTYVDNGIRYIK